MYEIIEYINEYEQEAKQFMISISVKEYGFIEFEQGFLESDYNKYKESGGNFWIVLDSNKNLIGTMALERKEKIGHLSGVYLHQEYRGKGIAQKLLEIVIDYSKQNNIEKIVLDTYERYSRAIKFYEKNNFIRLKEEEEKYYYMLDLIDGRSA